MSEKKFYISGQISGLDYEEAKQNFQQAEDRLRQIGAVMIFNPIKKVDQHLTWKEQMDICLEEIANSDVVVFQSNWKESIGARWEFQEAGRLKKTIRMFTESDLRDIQKHLIGNS
jgi:hypothetical protein